MIEEQNNFFNEYYESLGHYRWVGVKDLSEMFDISERTVFQWLKDKKIKGVKWKNKRLIDSVSVIGFLLQKKCLEMSQIKQREIKEKIEYEGFVKMGEELFD
jgi:transposase